MPIDPYCIVSVSGASIEQLVERLEHIEELTQIYRSDRADGVDAVLVTHSWIVKAMCSTENRQCRITVYQTGGLFPVVDVLRAIFSAAASAHGIAWYAADPVVGSTCPHCKATYKYPQEKFIRGTFVHCQNCTKVFDIQQASVERPPMRGLDQLTECPFCRVQDVYRKVDLDDKRIASCRSCGVPMWFPDILDDWDEYRQIQSDTRNECRSRQ